MYTKLVLKCKTYMVGFRNLMHVNFIIFTTFFIPVFIYNFRILKQEIETNIYFCKYDAKFSQKGFLQCLIEILLKYHKYIFQSAIILIDSFYI